MIFYGKKYDAKCTILYIAIQLPFGIMEEHNIELNRKKTSKIRDFEIIKMRWPHGGLETYPHICIQEHSDFNITRRVHLANVLGHDVGPNANAAHPLCYGT